MKRFLRLLAALTRRIGVWANSLLRPRFDVSEVGLNELELLDELGYGRD